MTSGLADEGSDYDLHAYTREAVPLEFRARLLKPRAARLELHNTFFEWSDEWIEPDGTVFDLMYRSCDLIEADVEARLGRGEGAVGYSTCLCHSVLQAQPVFDRQGWFRALQDRLKAATYPDRLVTGIIQRNLPLLGGNIHSYEHQIRSAFRRRDRRSTSAGFLTTSLRNRYSPAHRPPTCPSLLRTCIGTCFYDRDLIPKHRLRSDFILYFYSTPAIWPLFGYEGPSNDQGGYLYRGFNDIDWIKREDL
jgi:hypothetical protein